MAQELSQNVLQQFAAPVAPQLSYKDFLREYDGQHAEWVNYEIIKPMSVTRKHDDLTGFLRAVLRIFVEANDLGTIHGEPYQMKMTLPDEVPQTRTRHFLCPARECESNRQKVF